MNTDVTNVYYSGLLLEWPPRAIQRTDLEQLRDFSFSGAIAGTNWELFWFRSDKALRPEDRPGPYRYPILCRRSGSRILMLSVARQVVEHLMESELERVFSPRLRRVSIAVDGLVKAMADKPTAYSLSFAHARVPAFGSSLRALSFYGDDLAEASLFRERIGLMVFFTCGLREAAGGSEIVRLGADGTISFFMAESHRVLEVEKALGFLRHEGYLTSDVLAT
jgi:hypothetical protein